MSARNYRFAYSSVEAESTVDVAAKPKHGRVRDVLNTMKAKWPAVFDSDPPRPLTAEALEAAHRSLRYQYDGAAIDLALGLWVNTGRYLRAISDGEERVHLDGTLSGVWPSARERCDAAVALAGYLQRRSARH